MGTPDFAVPSLNALVASHHDVSTVVTQPDRPAGRGRRLRASPVADAATRHGLPLLKPERFRDPSVLDALRAANADAFAVVAFGEILRARHLSLPRHGCINVHPSLLPRHRGATPIQSALLAGDDVTGVTTMRMDRGVDTGDVLLQEAVEVEAGENAGSLHDRLADVGAVLLVRTLDGLEAGRLTPVPQPAEGVSVCGRIGAADRRVDWTESALSIYRRVRAFTPWPGVHTTRRERRCRLVRVAVRDLLPRTEPPGTVLVADPDVGLALACGTGSLWLHTLRPEGGTDMSAAAFLRGHDAVPGERWGDADG